METDNREEDSQTEPGSVQSAHKRKQSIVVNGRTPHQTDASPIKQNVQDVPPAPRSPTSSRTQQSLTENNHEDKVGPTASEDDTEARLEALARDRATLKDELVQLKKFLDDIREKHEQEMSSVRRQLEDTRSEKEHAETQYRNLLGKVNTIKSQLGERLKADAVCTLASPISGVLTSSRRI